MTVTSAIESEVGGGAHLHHLESIRIVLVLGSVASPPAQGVWYRSCTSRIYGTEGGRGPHKRTLLTLSICTCSSVALHKLLVLHIVRQLTLNSHKCSTTINTCPPDE